jgi:hypothetical protein
MSENDANQEEMKPPVQVEIERPIVTRLDRAQVQGTIDLPLWFLIEETTRALSFNNYKDFIDYVLCGRALPSDLSSAESGRIADEKEPRFSELVTSGRRSLPFTDSDAYRLLKTATEAFVAVNCGVVLYDQGGHPPGLGTDILQRILDGRVQATDTGIRTRWYDEYLKEVQGTADRTLPYLVLIRRKLPEWAVQGAFPVLDGVDDGLPKDCSALLQTKLLNPCLLELIWSYWHEQGMLVQTMNVISRRFQNIRGPAQKDPLAMVELDPLRPLNNLVWGYIQDEQHRLSLVRRAYEYDHHYGLRVDGKAVPPMRPADSRSKFLEAFHNLLYLCSDFFKRDDDTTVNADAFPVLIALRDVHMLLTEGAHNQFGDLPATARIEMLMQQWLLARPEFQQVLPTRIMVDYPEPWMDRVDAMKRLQGWIDTNVRHFRDLGRFGEQILLSIRFGNWNEADRDQAHVWARYWRHQIQNYIYAYRICTGVDLTADVTRPQQRRVFAAQPSVLLRQRLPGASPTLPLPAPAPAAPSMPHFRERRAARK